MESAFANRTQPQSYTANRVPEEVYNLRGINMVTPDQVVVGNEKTKGQVPLAYNARLHARNTSGRARSPIESRDGIKYYFDPIGETVDSTYTTGDSSPTLDTFGLTRWQADKFTAGNSNCLTRIDIQLSKNDSFDVAVLELREDVSGTPGDIIATTAVNNSALPDSGNAYVTFRFPSAPKLTSGTVYWAVLRTQEKFFSTETLKVGKNTASNTMLLGTATYAAGSDVATVSWASSTGRMYMKTYMSTPGRVLGSERREDTNGTKETLFITGTTLYKVSGTTTTSLFTGLSSDAEYYRFCQVNNITYIVNGYDRMLKYDGTTVTQVTLPYIPDNIAAYKNRLFFTTKADPNRVFFSNLAVDYETIDSVNFFYVPDPKSADPIKALVAQQDQLIIFTSETKYLLAGNDLASFTLRQATGTKGAMSQESVCVDHNYVYFLADDKRIYTFNGSTDYYISEPIQPILEEANDPESTYLTIWDRQLRIYFKYAGSPYHNYMALFYLTYREWFIDTETYTCCPLILDKDNNELLEFSSVVGTGYYAEQEPGAHLGAPIDFKYWTAYDKFDSGLSKTRIKKFRPFIESPELHITMLVGKDVEYKNSPRMRDYLLKPSATRYDTGLLYDNDVTYAAPTLIDRAVPMPGRGKLTQFRFQKYGAYTKVRVVGYGFIRTTGRAR